jgi:hypothetical protein
MGKSGFSPFWFRPASHGSQRTVQQRPTAARLGPAATAVSVDAALPVHELAIVRVRHSVASTRARIVQHVAHALFDRRRVCHACVMASGDVRREKT